MGQPGSFSPVALHTLSAGPRWLTRVSGEPTESRHGAACSLSLEGHGLEFVQFSLVCLWPEPSHMASSTKRKAGKCSLDLKDRAYS